VRPHRILIAALLVAAVAAAPAQAAVKLRIGTHNMLRGDATFTPLAGVIGWQEVNDPADRAKLQRTLGPQGFRTFLPQAGPAKAVPISWRTKYFVLRGSGSVLTHKGEAKVTPNRYVNWVILQRRGTQERFAFVNTHFISAAWTRHPERRARWLHHAQVLRQVISNLRAQGLRVFAVGDFNRHKAIPLPGMVYAPVAGTKAVPLDQIYVTQGTAHSASQRLPKNGSDHFAYRARVAW
jgi:hypothetical protein